MKQLILAFLLFIPLIGHCQTEQEKYYIYNIVTFSGNFKSEGVKVEVDNGVAIEKLLDDKGKRIIFKTPAGALMYFFSKGWEMYTNGSTSEGAMALGYGGTESTNYWILRKPCTKEEFEKAVKEAVKK